MNIKVKHKSLKINSFLDSFALNLSLFHMSVICTSMYVFVQIVSSQFHSQRQYDTVEKIIIHPSVSLLNVHFLHVPTFVLSTEKAKIKFSVVVQWGSMIRKQVYSAGDKI